MKTILIIEDDAFLRDLISKKLSSAGFTASEATDGEAGLKKAKEEKPSLILLDLLLPVPDGFEILSRLKQDPETSSIPVVILSNLGQKEDVDKGLGLGANDYLIKAQFTPDEIIAKVKETLGKTGNPAPQKPQ
ncbi:MAG: response regulator [bacterium]